jgi:prepilin-type N-terminal cleavage/methylation domain-containing protein
MNPAGHDQRGLTLTEVAIVLTIASIVLTGLVIFYLNSQALWVDGSSQAIAQREVTLVLDAITRRTHRAAMALPAGTPTTSLRLFTTTLGTEPESTYALWVAGDSLLHIGYPESVIAARQDLGPLIQSKIERFDVRTNGNMVFVDELRVHSAEGARISMSTRAMMMNRGAH